MFEKVNPSHPDKLADRIAGALVDLAYTKQNDPKISVEVLIGHNLCTIINETSVKIKKREVKAIVNRIVPEKHVKVKYVEVPQDEILAANQHDKMRCGDNGIFKGMPLTKEQKKLSKIAKNIYEKYPSDGKYILDKNKLVICQSKAKKSDLLIDYPHAVINPLGDWTGGINVDTGATNRKLGSDMADSITGGGLHGKDLSKSDVSISIYCFIKAQQLYDPYELSCAIGDDMVDGRPYSEIVELARSYIKLVGGFEKFAEWGLV